MKASELVTTLNTLNLSTEDLDKIDFLWDNLIEVLIVCEGLQKHIKILNEDVFDNKNKNLKTLSKQIENMAFKYEKLADAVSLMADGYDVEMPHPFSKED